MILCIEMLNYSTKQLLKLTNMFRNVTGYKINIQKCLEILYTSNECEKKIMKAISFTKAVKN
jgi:hypothetical protein